MHNTTYICNKIYYILLVFLALEFMFFFICLGALESWLKCLWITNKQSLLMIIIRLISIWIFISKGVKSLSYTFCWLMKKCSSLHFKKYVLSACNVHVRIGCVLARCDTGNTPGKMWETGWYHCIPILVTTPSVNAVEPLHNKIENTLDSDF